MALTLGQLHRTFQDSLDYLERKGIPMTNSTLRLRTVDGGAGRCRRVVRGASGDPDRRGGGSRYGGSRRGNEHEAAFYRNTLIASFLETSIIELALAHAPVPGPTTWTCSGRRRRACAIC